MPKIKVDHIVSFSSEDPVHTANNVLSTDSTKKWKCQTAGEKAAVIVLQLEKATLISGIDIGNEHSAYVEVLVNRSSSPDDFKVLLVMSSFMTPLECRQSTNANKVRMFSHADLRSPERDEKWDRIKIVCTQPFNKRVQYGLSFITLLSYDSKEAHAPALTQTKIGNFTLRASSPDNISAGNLFARRKELVEDTPVTAAAAIRVASSSPGLIQVSPKYKPKVKDAPSTSRNTETNSGENDVLSKPRNRNQLLYNDDEEKPNSKIDQLIEQKNKEKKEKELKDASEKAQKAKQTKQSTSTNVTKQDQLNNKPNIKPSTSTADPDKNKRKLNSKDSPHKKPKPSRVTKPFHELLSGVTIVISGIENPERSNIRNEALSMGATYKADWGNTCTHLICAFTNTPKFMQVKGKGKIVNRMWVNDCFTQHKRLPWRRYALDSKQQTKAESEDEIWEKKDEAPDTFEIENDSTDAEDEIASFGITEKVKNREHAYSIDTDEEDIEIENTNGFPELANFFSGKVLYIDKELGETTTALLTRYITAYDGLLVDDSSDIVDYAVSSPASLEVLKALCPDAKVVSPDWIWECHNSKQLVSDDCYRL